MPGISSAVSHSKHQCLHVKPHIVHALVLTNRGDVIMLRCCKRSKWAVPGFGIISLSITGDFFCPSLPVLFDSICNFLCLFVCQVIFLIWFPWKTCLCYHGSCDNLNAVDNMAVSDGGRFLSISGFFSISQNFWGEQICPIIPTAGSSSVSPPTGTQRSASGKEPATNSREADLCCFWDSLKWGSQIV